MRPSDDPRPRSLRNHWTKGRGIFAVLWEPPVSRIQQSLCDETPPTRCTSRKSYRAIIHIYWHANPIRCDDSVSAVIPCFSDNKQSARHGRYAWETDGGCIYTESNLLDWHTQFGTSCTSPCHWYETQFECISYSNNHKGICKERILVICWGWGWCKSRCRTLGKST